MISTLGIKLPKQAVQIFICTFLPSTIWIGKMHVTLQPFLDLAPVCKFCSPVTGNTFAQLRGKVDNAKTMAFSNGRGSSVRHLDCYVKPGLAFCQGGKASLALALAAHHRICIPMPSFQMAVYRLVPLSYSFVQYVWYSYNLESVICEYFGKKELEKYVRDEKTMLPRQKIMS